MASERDQLAREIFAADNYYAPDPYEEWGKASTAHREYAYTIADGLTANGWGHVPTALHQAADEVDGYADATLDLIDSQNGARLAFEEIVARLRARADQMEGNDE